MTLNLCTDEKQFLTGFDNRRIPLALEDISPNSVSLVICNGVLEKFSIVESIDFMAKLGIMLREGGELHVTCLDPWQVCEAYTNGQLTVEELTMGMSDKKTLHTMETLSLLLDSDVFTITKKTYINANIVINARKN